ncbi:ABC transporter permease [Kineosporia babensis]|uniref:ABC transporter permease n=1 Tax=Kineosporia babensis TaxID=499548 RepID=A0A9X1NCM8_9ACTN|nr:ABC transporter permease [Kineosporia babensis]MCD5311314.1 ABC transporter permease [Kineosporia babensis]
MSMVAVNQAEEPKAGSRWILPLIVVLLVAAVAGYIAGAELDSIESRALEASNIVEKTWQHVRLVLVSTAVVIALGVPLGIVLSRRWARFVRPPVLLVANAGQAVPSVGILVLLAIAVGVGFRMAVVALVAYALLPILRNTIVGLQQVDPAVIDAARGMGMSPARLLWKVELPLAVPVMLAGIRVALILNVGVATLATFTNAGGLGDLIEGGIATNRMPVLAVGCALTIALALLVDWLAGTAERALSPKGI